MKINQVLLRFTIVQNDNQAIFLQKEDLKQCTEGIVTENQYNVLIFQFVNLTIKYFVRSSSGFIFLKKINTISNYRNIEQIIRLFIANYIEPFCVVPYPALAVNLQSVNFHWEISVQSASQIKHFEFQEHYQRIPDLEITERVCTKYKTAEQLVFTVYSQGCNLKLTGCTKNIEKVSKFKQHFEKVVKEWSMSVNHF